MHCIIIIIIKSSPSRSRRVIKDGCNRTYITGSGHRQNKIERYRRHSVDDEPAAQVVDGDEFSVDDHFAVLYERRPEVDDHIRHEQDVNGEVDPTQRTRVLVPLGG